MTIDRAPRDDPKRNPYNSYRAAIAAEFLGKDNDVFLVCMYLLGQADIWEFDRESVGAALGFGEHKVDRIWRVLEDAGHISGGLRLSITHGHFDYTDRVFHEIPLPFKLRERNGVRVNDDAVEPAPPPRSPELQALLGDHSAESADWTTPHKVRTRPLREKRGPDHSALTGPQKARNITSSFPEEGTNEIGEQKAPAGESARDEAYRLAAEEGQRAAAAGKLPEPAELMKHRYWKTLGTGGPSAALYAVEQAWKAAQAPTLGKVPLTQEQFDALPAAR